MSRFSYIPKQGERVEASSRLVKKSNNLLDVGCGDGIISYFVKDRVKNIYGVDGDLKALKQSKKAGIKVKLTDLDKDALPYQNDFFDTVICLDVIEHVRDPRDLLIKIFRVLKENGDLIISTPNIRFTNHLYELVVNGKFPKTSTDSSLYDGGHFHFFTYSDLINLMKETGFRISKIDGIINKPRRGWKGRVLEFIFGKKLMLEFRAPGILIVGKKHG